MFYRLEYDVILLARQRPQVKVVSIGDLDRDAVGEGRAVVYLRQFGPIGLLNPLVMTALTRITGRLIKHYFLPKILSKYCSTLSGNIPDLYNGEVYAENDSANNSPSFVAPYIETVSDQYNWVLVR